LIVSSRKESIQHFKKPWAHDHEPIRELVDAVKVCWLLFCCRRYLCGRSLF